MKYGDFKYGEEKYGINITTGNGTISPSGSLSSLKVLLCDLGLATINLSGSIARNIFKVLSGSITINGIIVKLTNRSFTAGTLTISGSITKKIYLIFSGILNINGSLNKLTQQVMSGIVSMSGLLSTLKFYFLVTIDQILLPLGVRVLRDSRAELIPSTRDNTEEIPGKHGELDFGTELKAGMLELHVATDDGLTPLQKEQNRRFYAKHLNPLNGNKVLIFDDDPSKAYNVKYSGKIDINPQGSWFDFVIPFKMSDPIACSVEDNINTGSGIITNDGTFETPLIIEIPGPATNPSISVGATVIAYTGYVSASASLIINTENQTAYIGSVNAIANIAGDIDYVLEAESSVSVVASISGTTVTWKDKWL
jgi:phage-related protein